VAVTTVGVAFVRSVGRRVDPILMRLTGGRFSSVYPFQAVLLTHRGAKSGVRRIATLVYFTDRGRIILVASDFGSSRNPGWYYNVKANPEVMVYGRRISGRFTATELVGDERDRLFHLARSAETPYDGYERRAGIRRIPVIALSPVV
jgi:deazaflavin-dependent oxidoreductase (nitroreductase family)